MNPKSRRTPFCLPSPSSSYASSPAVSSSSLGSSRLYGRETSLSDDRLPRTSSPYKTDTSRLLALSRDYSSPDDRSTSRRLPSALTSSGRSYDRSWAESSLSSRSKLTDSEGRLGMPSVLLSTTDDGDSKRAKLLYSNRGLYSRTPSTSATGSTCSSYGLSSGRGSGEKPKDSSWSSRHFQSWSSSSSSSSSSKSVLSRRELETKSEAGLSGLREGRIRSPGLAPSLYQTDRVNSTYAQGARPKQSAYSPSSSSSSFSSSSSSFSTYSDSTLSRHLSSTSHRSSPLVRDFSTRTSAPVLNGSSTRHLSREQARNPEPSTGISSSNFSWVPLYTPPPARAEATPPRRPAPEDREPDGRRSTRRLLSRLLSRRSSRDSSSGSSSVLSLDDDRPSTGGESVDSDEGTRMSSVEPDAGNLEATSGLQRNRRPVLSPIQESNLRGHLRGSTQPRVSSWREADISSDDNASSVGSSSSSSSRLSSSLRSRYPHLLSRLRRHTRDQSSQEEGYSHTQRLLIRRDNPQEKASQDEEEEEEVEEEKEEGAVGSEARGAGRPGKLEVEMLPDLEDSSDELWPHDSVRAHENMSGSSSPLSGADGQREKPASSSHQEKLRKIKERLLLEESDEDEGDLCRICQMGEESASNPLIQPCRCTGSLQYVHQECIKRWLRSKIGSGTNLEAITTCELCKEKLRLNIDNFDVQDLYRTHVQSEYDEFLNSGLYLVALLHFCEHFSDVLGAIDGTGLLSLARILHDHMDNLEIPHSESDEESPDSRPSIDFSDLDDDLEEEC